MLSKSIPSYAKNYKKEYTYLIDIKKKCEKFHNITDDPMALLGHNN